MNDIVFNKIDRLVKMKDSDAMKMLGSEIKNDIGRLLFEYANAKEQTIRLLEKK